MGEGEESEDVSPRGEEKEKRHVKSVRMDGERRVAGVGALYVFFFFPHGVSLHPCRFFPVG